MAKYKSVQEIKEKLNIIFEKDEINPYDWIYIDDFLNTWDYLDSIPKEQASYEWATITDNSWVLSICINDGEGFLHFIFKVYADPIDTGKHLN